MQLVCEPVRARRSKKVLALDATARSELSEGHRRGTVDPGETWTAAGLPGVLPP